MCFQVKNLILFFYLDINRFFHTDTLLIGTLVIKMDFAALGAYKLKFSSNFYSVA